MSSELKKASVGPAFIGGICLFLLFGLLAAFWFRLGGRTESYDDKRAADRMTKLSALLKENNQRLNGYALVNKEKGIVQVPIDDAMKLVLPELKAKPVQASAVKVENPYPAGLQQAVPATAPAAVSTSPAPATSPAPVASPSAAASPAASQPAPALATPAP